MASAAFTAVSEMPPSGSRAAACNWTNDELTKALELVPSALLSLSHQALVSPPGGYAFARSALIRCNLTRTGGRRATLATAPIGILLFAVMVRSQACQWTEQVTEATDAPRSPQRTKCRP